MLTRADLSLNIHCLHLLSRLGILPLKINLETGKINVKNHGLGIWWCLIFISQMLTFWLAWRVSEKYKLSPGEAIQTLPLDYMTLIPGQMCIWCGFINFKRWPEATAEIFNGFIDAPRTTINSLVKTPQQHFWTRLTLLEMVTAAMPALTYPVAACVIVAFEILSTWPATRGLNVVLRFGLIAADSWTLVARTSWVYFNIVIQLLFLSELTHFLKREKTRLR